MLAPWHGVILHRPWGHRLTAISPMCVLVCSVCLCMLVCLLVSVFISLLDTPPAHQWLHLWSYIDLELCMCVPRSASSPMCAGPADGMVVQPFVAYVYVRRRPTFGPRTCHVSPEFSFRFTIPSHVHVPSCTAPLFPGGQRHNPPDALET